MTMERRGFLAGIAAALLAPLALLSRSAQVGAVLDASHIVLVPVFRWDGSEWVRLRMSEVRPGDRIAVGPDTNYRFGTVVHQPSVGENGIWGVNVDVKTLETLLA